MTHRFAVVVDGTVAASEGLPGKPEPDTYLHASAQLGIDASQAAVTEDAKSGATSGRSGNCGLVIGVDRGAGAQTLLRHGADYVGHDLRELVPYLESTCATVSP